MATFDENTLYILDSYGLIYRAYFAFISHPLTFNGKNISAVFAFFRNLHNILEHYKPKCLVAALDSIGPTFRHEKYPEYKATREKSPDDLIAQIPWIEEILESLGIPQIRVNGYEADDIIATLAKKCKASGRTCRILSGDKDLMQLVCDEIQILKPDHAGVWKVCGAEGVKAEWGVYPEKLLDLLSLTGDAADNVPGVKGVGVKTAVKFLEQYETLDGIYNHQDEIKGAIGDKIRNGKELAFFSRELITLCDTVPLDEKANDRLTQIKTLLNSSDKKNIEQRFDFSAVAKKLEKYGCPSVAKSFLALGKCADESSINLSEEKLQTKSEKKSEPTENPEEENLNLIPNKGNYKAITNISELHKFIDDVLKEGVVAYDSETTGLEPLRDKILGFSLSIKKGAGVWVPFSSGDSLFETDSVPKDEAFKELERIFQNPKMTVIMHNAKFDYKFLMTNFGMKKYDCKIYDTIVAAWLLDPDKTFKKSYSLENLGKLELGLIGVEYSDIVPKGGIFSDIPLDVQANYASEDADFTLQLWKKYENDLKENKLYDLFINLEMPLLPILSEMEMNGIHIDRKILDDYNKELTEQIEIVQNEIYKEVGHKFNVASTKQLQEVLFNELGLKSSKKNSRGFSTDSSVLEELSAFHNVPKLVLEYREMAKLQSTYVAPLPALADKEDRVHTNYLQTGTATGRLAANNPNLQNIPIRTEAGRKIRSAFTAPKGKVYISADYSQIELVVLAHLSGDKNMCDAFKNGIDVHKSTAQMIFGVPMENVTAEMRRTAKTINFGVIYGMGAFSLAKDLGISRTQSAEFIEKYYEEYSAIHKFMEKTIETVETTGFLETIMGRRRYIPGIKSTNQMQKRAAERVAKNTPIQGSAADIVKKAMIDLSAELKKQNSPAKMLLQVHDELILECPDDENEIQKTIEIVKSCMENSVKLNVPLKVSVEYGKNWGEFH